MNYEQNIITIVINNYIMPANHFATAKAAAAAAKPISITFIAPNTGGCPVTLLLKYPKIKRQMVVNMAEINNPSLGVAVKKYAVKGIRPPTI